MKYCVTLEELANFSLERRSRPVEGSNINGLTALPRETLTWPSVAQCVPPGGAVSLLSARPKERGREWAGKETKRKKELRP